MKYRQTVKKTALMMPVLKRVLSEKDNLYQITLIQKNRINELQVRNDQLRKELARGGQNRGTIWPLLKEQILQREKPGSHFEKPTSKHKPPFKFNWVVPAVVTSSGGQTDIFRTVKYLISKGHTCRIYIFDPAEKSSLEEQKELIRKGFPDLKTDIFYNARKMKDCDAIFATHWFTAYPVYNFKGTGKKYYFVQGYEPHTQPAGYLSFLAEDTYNFGFKGITLGAWLNEKLTNEYKMVCEYFDFGYDPEEYYVTDQPRSKDIFYYAQPQKAHRGFELGMLALEIFHRKNPDSKIHLFGGDLSQYEIPFPFIDRGILTVRQLNELYNHCAAGLALSFTNISLIPLEMIAAGCMPVINDAYQTRMINYADMVTYASQSPKAMAEALQKAIKTKVKTSNLSATYSWEHSNRRIEKIITDDLTP